MSKTSNDAVAAAVGRPTALTAFKMGAEDATECFLSGGSLDDIEGWIQGAAKSGLVAWDDAATDEYRRGWESIVLTSG